MNSKDLAAAAALFKNPVPTNGLKRNTACQQCRKRKLKCDTKRPCGTCIRSHQYAHSHPQDGVVVPSEPECVYGDEKEASPPSNCKVEKLEGRVAELEKLLQQMQLALDESQQARSPAKAGQAGPHSIQNMTESTSIIPSAMVGSPSYTPQLTPSPTSGMKSSMTQNLGSPGSFDTLNDPYSYPSSSESATFSSIYPTSMADGALVSSALTNTYSKQAQLLILGWPQGLPDPEVTRHLIHAFFAFYMHAGRLFHGPTFLASLDLPPTDPRFPFVGTLHAMCAVGSLYTAEIPQPPIRERLSFPAKGTGLFFALDEIFSGKWRQYNQRPDSFAEHQAKLARIANELCIDRGEHLVECLQSQVILTWFYLTQARWSEAHISSGHSLRATVPFGFNIVAPFHNIDHMLHHQQDCPPSILEPPRNTTESEMRRNVFWIAYAMERQQGAGNMFAMVLDDLDICQLLPIRGDQFEQGIEVPAMERQWSHDRTMFLIHPPTQTDSFNLFVKSLILLSHVKNFNLRVRGRYFAGDLAVYSPYANPGDEQDKWDPRGSPAFEELDQITAMFRQSFPSHLKNPTQDNMVDPYLFSASSAAYLAQIILHQPHASFGDNSCSSSIKILKASRGILELMYGLSATSYDVSLLDQLPVLAWNVAGTVLTRALKVALDKNDTDEVMIMHAEILYIHDMLAKAGERMPLAYRYKMAIYDLLASLCGQQFVEGIQDSPYRKRPGRPLNPVDMYTPTTFMETLYSPATYAMGTVPQM